MWLWILAQASLACSPNGTLYGFADWVDGSIGLPTDGRVVVSTGIPYPLTFTRLDTGEVTDGVASWELPHLAAYGLTDAVYAPVTPLEPGVTYRAETTDYNGVTSSATFTTGSGPTPTDFAPPVLSGLATAGWAEGDLICVTQGIARTITATVALPGGLPLGTYIAVRSPWSLENAGYFEHVALAADADLAVASYERADASPEDLALHDCLTPVLILPSGHEIAGAEVCLAPPPIVDTGDADADTDAPADAVDEPDDDGKSGCGCAPGDAAASWALAIAGLALARRRRSPCGS